MLIVALLALLSAGLFTGAAFYIGVAEHPARLQLDDAPLLAQWKPSYHRGLLMQASLALIGFALGVAAWWTDPARDWLYLIGGLAMLANWPWTQFAMMAGNNRLKATPIEQAGPESRALLLRWGRLHAVRTGLGALACLLFVVAIYCDIAPFV